ncbi:MAG: hypothetical protein GXP30_05635 [Verrucomicrobia bacterium]|nr:hypothetical protein [Verrucomicrobiota bacterium]
MTSCLHDVSEGLRGMKMASMIMLTEKITDVNSGKTVKRSFHTPEIKHWTNVSKLPNPTKLETKSATDR